jgi:hypothetical protein
VVEIGPPCEAVLRWWMTKNTGRCTIFKSKVRWKREAGENPHVHCAVVKKLWVLQQKDWKRELNSLMKAC